MKILLVILVTLSLLPTLKAGDMRLASRTTRAHSDEQAILHRALLTQQNISPSGTHGVDSNNLQAALHTNDQIAMGADDQEHTDLCSRIGLIGTVYSTIGSASGVCAAIILPNITGLSATINFLIGCAGGSCSLATAAGCYRFYNSYTPTMNSAAPSYMTEQEQDIIPTVAE